MTATLDTETIAEIRSVTGLDVSELATPGRTGTVAGVGGTGVSSLISACTQVAPHLELREWQDGSDADPHPAVAILVVDPSAAVGEEEVALLAALRREAGVVAVVCNKIDVYWDWPMMLRRIRSVLDPAGRLPLFGVAATAGGTGIAALTEWLTTVTSAPAGTRYRLRQSGVALAAVDAAGTPPPDESVRLRDLGEQRRRTVAGRDRGRAERYAAARIEFASARAEVIEELGATVRSLTAAADARCDRVERHEVPAYRKWLDAQLASAAGRFAEASVARLTEAAAVSLAGIGPRLNVAPPAVRAVSPPAGRGVSTPPVTMAGPRRGAEDALFALLGVSTGFGVGRAIAAGVSAIGGGSMGAGSAVAWALTPLTVVTGLAIALWVIGVRRTSAARTQLRAATASALAELRATCERLVVARSSAPELEVTGHIARHYDRLARDTARRAAAIDAEIGRLRSPAADPARLRFARALADRLAVLADPEAADTPGPGPGTDDEQDR
ncbi:hypothetical protein [Gordonia sp. (in: high G+C Gram-positive bacteria)]|uniref:hypothetical protein n=1 Tax=Gordonia sp. (in: high G+C Gram-positive bacteria) TaxID=84139 RepID=UPI002CC538BF|nr:hypothetical protein [Gordonia sp. (in: high G+C Gram-positive bacteria)]HMS77237.1 hypothetical protein [Gordonia sp. (in: high G+C Gram-positive bacteria)]